jgi:DNA gyrase inhibitor GyrI
VRVTGTFARLRHERRRMPPYSRVLNIVDTDPTSVDVESCQRQLCPTVSIAAHRSRSDRSKAP